MLTDVVPTFLVVASGNVREIIAMMLLKLNKVINNLDIVRNY